MWFDRESIGETEPTGSARVSACMGDPTDGRQVAEPGSNSIIVVEPDVLARMVIPDYLRNCGYKVIEAVSGEDVLTVLRRAARQTSYLRRCACRVFSTGLRSPVIYANTIPTSLFF